MFSTDIWYLFDHVLTASSLQLREVVTMGYPVSPVTANFFMEFCEQTAIRKLNTWFCYVDDLFLIWRHSNETLPEFLEDRNNTHLQIQFTIEVENK